MSPTLTQMWSQRIGADYGMACPRVVLADGDDVRARIACEGMLEAGIQPVLLGSAHEQLPQDVAYIELSDARSDAVAKVLSDLAERRNWDDERYRRALQDPQIVSAAMVRAGEADAAVAGAVAASSEVIRAGLQVIGLADGAPLLSSCFMLELESGRQVTFGDCAVVPTPDAEQLAAIAIETSATYATLTGREPSVAMLSFSTYGSASNPQVDLVREATELVRQQRPGLAVDGDLQFDAAFDPSVGTKKCPGSTVAGHANTFVFPNLSAGNIGYKIAQRLGGAEAYGPILQGLAAPMNDLSRGCTPDDILNVALISALQAAV